MSGATMAEFQEIQGGTGPDIASAAPRLILLCAFTGIFMACWGQAQPDPVLLAARQQIQPNFSMWVPKSYSPAPFQLVQPRSRNVAASVVSTRSAVGFGPELEIRSLQQGVSIELLMEHVGQLPLNIPAGEYEISSQQGRLGILSVRTNSRLSGKSRQSHFLTSHGDMNCEFALITSEKAHPPIAAAEESLQR